MMTPQAWAYWVLFAGIALIVLSIAFAISRRSRDRHGSTYRNRDWTREPRIGRRDRTHDVDSDQDRAA